MPAASTAQVHEPPRAAPAEKKTGSMPVVASRGGGLKTFIIVVVILLVAGLGGGLFFLNSRGSFTSATWARAISASLSPRPR